MVNIDLCTTFNNNVVHKAMSKAKHISKWLPVLKGLPIFKIYKREHQHWERCHVVEGGWKGRGTVVLPLLSIRGQHLKRCFFVKLAVVLCSVSFNGSPRNCPLRQANALSLMAELALFPCNPTTQVLFLSQLQLYEALVSILPFS